MRFIFAFAVKFVSGDLLFMKRALFAKNRGVSCTRFVIFVGEIFLRYHTTEETFRNTEYCVIRKWLVVFVAKN